VTRPTRGTPKRCLSGSDPARRCVELERKCAELEQKVRDLMDTADRGNNFWLDQIEAIEARHREELRVERAKREQLRAELKKAKEAASRPERPQERRAGPSAAQVHREYTAKRPECASEKEAELAVAAALGCSDRTVRRRLLDFKDQMKRSMRPLPVEE